MPKLKNQLPKMCKMGVYAVVNYQGKKPVLGKWGTPEAKQAYARFITEIQNKPVDVPRPPKGVAFSETYDKDSYRKAIQRAIKRANKTLPPDEQIPNWYPYSIRHSAATFVEETEGLDESQAVLGHTSADMTRRYAKAQQAIQKRVALKQENPFAE